MRQGKHEYLKATNFGNKSNNKISQELTQSDSHKRIGSVWENTDSSTSNCKQRAMEWLASPHRFRPAFQLLQNVTYKMVSRRKSPTESESEAEEEPSRPPTAVDSSTPRRLKGSTGSTSSNADDSQAAFDDVRNAQSAKTPAKGKNLNDVSSNDSVFDDFVDAGAPQRREAQPCGSTSSTGSTDSNSVRSNSQTRGNLAYRKQNSLTIQLPTVEMLKRSHSTAPNRSCRSPRSLRVDQFDKALYRGVDEASGETRSEQPTVGRICAHVAYDVDAHTLKLALISTTLCLPASDAAPASSLLPFASQLAAASTPSSASASPVSVRQRVCLQVTLMPDRITKQSALQRSARSIHWKEELLFASDSSHQLNDVCDKWLKIAFTEFDRSTQPYAVAECRIDLGKLDLLRGEDVSVSLTKCARLVASCGELLISLNHLPNAGRLNVDVLQARGLFKRSKGRSLDTYVKVSLSDTQGRFCKSKKTSVVRNCTEPRFNETFVFDTNRSEQSDLFFDGHTVSVYLYASSSALTERDEVIGRVLFGPPKYASGDAETDGWRQLRNGRHVKEWYDLRQPARFGSDSEKLEKTLKTDKDGKTRLTATVSLLA